MSDNTRWTISVPKGTDISVRTLLASKGMKKGDLSKFVKDAVSREVFRANIAAARAGFADLAPDEVQDLVDEALRETRATNR